jgi:hypothetical protein
VGFIAAPLLGASVLRLIGYGWPALIVGATVLLSAHVIPQRLLQLLALSFALAWVPPLVSLFAVGTLGAAIVIVVAVPAHVVAVRWLPETRRSSSRHKELTESLLVGEGSQMAVQ